MTILPSTVVFTSSANNDKYCVHCQMADNHVAFKITHNDTELDKQSALYYSVFNSWWEYYRKSIFYRKQYHNGIVMQDYTKNMDGYDINMIKQWLEDQEEYVAKLNGFIDFHQDNPFVVNQTKELYHLAQLSKRNDNRLIIIEDFCLGIHNEIALRLFRVLKNQLKTNSSQQNIITTTQSNLIENKCNRADCVFYLNNGVIKSLTEINPQLTFIHNLQFMMLENRLE